mmetsp:Transcript_45472/g.52517  ORF Transcript_45472/g.52517 Transcript_45472/m.52517 type:complete len:292 (+) Transcript_45472:144-1019(+)
MSMILLPFRHSAMSLSLSLSSTTVASTSRRALLLRSSLSSLSSLSEKMMFARTKTQHRSVCSDVGAARQLRRQQQLVFNKMRSQLPQQLHVVDSVVYVLGGSSKRFMMSASDSSNKEEKKEAGTIQASITFAETDEEYLSLGGESNEDNNSNSDADTTTIDPTLYTQPIIIEMPPMDDISDDASHCSVEEWFFKEGDVVRTNDVLCDISTPDFVFGMQIDDEELGILKTIHVQPHIKVPDHTPLCTIYHKKTHTSKLVEDIKENLEIQKEKIQTAKEKLKTKIDEKIKESY